MKVYIVYHNTPWEHSHPFAVFSTRQLAEKWIKNLQCHTLSYGIQPLELDYSPEDWMEIEENEEEYFPDYHYAQEKIIAAGESDNE